MKGLGLCIYLFVCLHLIFIETVSNVVGRVIIEIFCTCLEYSLISVYKVYNMNTLFGI